MKVLEIPTQINERLDELMKTADQIGNIGTIVAWFDKNGSHPMIHEFRMWQKGVEANHDTTFLKFGEVPPYYPIHRIVLVWNNENQGWRMLELW